MRALVLLAAIGAAGCPSNTQPECTTDSQCGGDVCARSGECLPASDVRAVRTSWTIHGMTASASTCAATPDFHIYFYSDFANDSFGFAPVPCNAGSFFIDKLPTRYVEVQLGVDNRFDQSAVIDQTNMVTFDLTP